MRGEEDFLPTKLTASSIPANEGTNTGTSILFYASYVYFEKLRVKQRKPKSKHREEMEHIWGEDGFDIETSSRGVSRTRYP